MKQTEAIEKIKSKLKENEKLRQINCELLEQKNSLREERDRYKKAVEIIKNKGIDILEFKATKKAKTYNENTKRVYVKDYTDEEYDFLKEVFK